MKKNFFLYLSVALSLITMPIVTSCSDNDDEKVEQKTYTVETSKEVIETNLMGLMTASAPMLSDPSVKALSTLQSIIKSSDLEALEIPVNEETNMMTFFFSEILTGKMASKQGTYTCKNGTFCKEGFEKGDKLKFVFPVATQKNSLNTNNAALTVQFGTTNNYPKEITLVVDGKEAMRDLSNYEFSTTTNNRMLPTKMNSAATMGKYKMLMDVNNTNKNLAASFSYLLADSELLSLSTSIEGISINDNFLGAMMAGKEAGNKMELGLALLSKITKITLKGSISELRLEGEVADFQGLYTAIIKEMPAIMANSASMRDYSKIFELVNNGLTLNLKDKNGSKIADIKFAQKKDPKNPIGVNFLFSDGTELTAEQFFTAKNFPNFMQIIGGLMKQRP